MSEQSPDVIFVEDDEALRIGASRALELEGFAVSAFAEASLALSEIDVDFPGVVVSDVRLPGMDGIEFFARLRERDPDMQVIFTTAHGDIDMAVDAMKNGAADFFPKPYSVSRLAHAIRRASERRSLKIENRKLRAELKSHSKTAMVGRAPASIRLNTIAQEVARTETDLLLQGAPGTGKSFLARRIHDLSHRADRPFVVVDPGVFANAEADLLLYGRDPSAALSRSGMIERANGGTLVLDAIERIPSQARARLVSMIDNRSFLALGAERPRKIDLRIIGTSSSTEVDASGLRDRLGGITLGLPSLIERKEDIPELFRLFVREYEESLGRKAEPVNEMEWKHLISHDWPGNLRELRMFAQNFVLGLTHLATSSTVLEKDVSLRSMIANFEKAILEDAMVRTNGKISEVQRSLSIPRKTLYDKLNKYGIKPDTFRD
ncbi:sigma-54-dependent transcriptional regulator [Qipengyuania huizhouensis]|uniref:sigma-54-dependent transcriptional regulator n=1 Tax=Qipengyuania huizhouensis TaxID=2867245 RepID=UPI00181678F0|nr:sigma-54 dependent transcriptional regulator [Qipengyuania huizhouensis]MBA4764377.1 sigma-54-dependent Fis family transcriptional regulator [Erythrobacter sp.]MBX7461515.1 sigma-54 dependent transcriptional regulator [Qipengyuania huizhouensis]